MGFVGRLRVWLGVSFTLDEFRTGRETLRVAEDRGRPLCSGEKVGTGRQVVYDEGVEDGGGFMEG